MRTYRIEIELILESPREAKEDLEGRLVEFYSGLEKSYPNIHVAREYVVEERA